MHLHFPPEWLVPITSQDFFLIGVLVFLEGVLSVDNALVLAILAKPLPPSQRRKALTYGMGGAIFFRFLALLLLSYLVKWTWIKFVGGGYLLFMGIRHFFQKAPESKSDRVYDMSNFWKTVVIIELTDIAFALDSILAAVALTPKMPVVFIGGVLGIFMMRFSAGLFIRLLEKFPELERTAYILIIWIGLKICVEGLHLESLDFHEVSNPGFWVFWVGLASILASGFLGKHFRRAK